MLDIANMCFPRLSWGRARRTRPGTLITAKSAMNSSAPGADENVLGEDFHPGDVWEGALGSSGADVVKCLICRYDTMRRQY